MFENFDFFKAGKVTSVVLRGSRRGLKKMAHQAYGKLREYAEDDDLTSARAEAATETKHNKEETGNGSV